MIAKNPAQDVIRGGIRFSQKIGRKKMLRRSNIATGEKFGGGRPHS